MNNERLQNLKQEEQHFITNFRVVILAEPKTGGTTLHHKLQSGYTCIVVRPHNKCQVDELIYGDNCITTDIFVSPCLSVNA